MSFFDRPLAQLVLFRFREFRREPGVIFWVFGFPIVLALCLGLAFREKAAEETTIAVVQSEGAAAVAAAIDEVEGLVAEVVPEAEARLLLQKGVTDVVLFTDGETRFLIDPSRPGGRLAEIAARYALSRNPAAAAELETELATTPGQRYIDFLLPGILGMGLMSGGIWGVGFAIVMLRSRKLLKRYAATPMRRSDFLLSFGLFRLVVAAAESGVLILFGWLLFDLELRGSFLDLVILIALAALAFAGLGLLIGCRAQNPQTAAGLVNLVTMPMFLLSGVFFSADRFPDWSQPVVQALPLTALNDALRAVINDGTRLIEIGHEPLLLLAWGAVPFAVALRLFRWT